MDNISLKVNGHEYSGWTSIQVQRGMDQIAGAFGFQATDIYPGHSEKWNITMGSECTVTVNGKTLITGYVDQIDIFYNMGEHTFEVKGRDKTGDLVDCCYDSAKNQWNNATIQTIVNDLCNSVTVPLVIDPTVTSVVTTKVPSFKINEGDTLFESISKLCKSIAILPITYGDGKLTLTRARAEYVTDRLEKGKNILAGSFTSSNLDRFKTYIVKSQHSGLDEWDNESVTQAVGRFDDYVISRNRPLVILSSEKSTSEQCKKQAEWEARYRAGRSRMIEYKIQGWLQSNKDLWPINKRVNVVDDFFGISDNYLITEVSHRLGDSDGSVTELRLMSPDAYDILPEKLAVKKEKDDTFDEDDY
jgi:prophage tail gpP-like protein